jgi:hypothetical protein
LQGFILAAALKPSSSTQFCAPLFTLISAVPEVDGRRSPIIVHLHSTGLIDDCALV